MFSVGLPGLLTATSADGCRTKWRIVAVAGLRTVLRRVAEGTAEGVDGFAPEAEPDGVCPFYG